MAVFRIEKARDYTAMSSHHLRNRSLPPIRATSSVCKRLENTKREYSSSAHPIGCTPAFYLPHSKKLSSQGQIIRNFRY